jgi:uncharacterized membrane protein
MSVSDRSRLGAVMLLAAVLGGCEAEPSVAPQRLTADTPTRAVCPPQQTLTYANFGQPFMAKYCLQCHSASLSASRRTAAPLGADYDTREDVQRLAASIDRWAAAGPDATNRQMPLLDTRPTDEERTQLGIWLACGAP